SLKTSIKTITYLSDIGCLEIQGASLQLIMWLLYKNNAHIKQQAKRITDKKGARCANLLFSMFNHLK
ncbi:hypothetical protein, partial [Escherichia coli]|uniref:hypothetical protein n=1 Tax=Escherichia coli TaxID=562 RepID=UPI001FF6BF50